MIGGVFLHTDEWKSEGLLLQVIYVEIVMMRMRLLCSDLIERMIEDES
jgi:hypothetical protein